MYKDNKSCISFLEQTHYKFHNHPFLLTFPSHLPRRLSPKTLSFFSFQLSLFSLLDFFLQPDSSFPVLGFSPCHSGE